MANEITVKKLRSFFDQEGELFETLRSDDPLFDGRFGQNLVSIVKPGIIKGLHIHERQTEYTTCLRGDILYVGVIETPEGPKIQKFRINANNRLLLKTSPGIWHGYKVMGCDEAVVLYTMGNPYDLKDPDTRDKDPYAFGDIWHQD